MMVRFPSSRFDIATGKKKMVFAAIVAIVALLLGTLWFWIRVRMGLRLVRIAPYHVSVPNKPSISGNVYLIGLDRLLVVLNSADTGERESYLLDPEAHRIGLPSFAGAKCFPRAGIALIPDEVFEGYPDIGTLDAEWRLSPDTIGVRIRGFSEELESPDPNREGAVERLIPLAHQEEIIVRRE